MSTILKALRRLEDDSNSPRPDSLPATDPAAADELRSRSVDSADSICERLAVKLKQTDYGQDDGSSSSPEAVFSRLGAR